MSRKPWMKWFPADWRADPALRMCSIAARGMWMEMLCLMHEAEPYGSLLINGMMVSDRQLAGLAGVSVREVAGYLKELRAAGVFSEDNGIIISRRMKRDAEKAEKDRANGKDGGNPILKGGVNPQLNGGDKAHMLEARSQTPERKKENTASAVSPTKLYAFESGIIRLSQKDFDQWKKAYSSLSLEAELLSLSQWAQEQGPKWFHAVSSALAKRNREILVRLEQSRRDGGLTNDEKYFGVGNTPGII